MQVTSSEVAVTQGRPLHRLEAQAQVGVPLHPLGIGMQAKVRSCTQMLPWACRPAGQTPPSAKNTAPPWTPLPTQTEPLAHAGWQSVVPAVASEPASVAWPPTPTLPPAPLPPSLVWWPPSAAPPLPT